MGAFAMPAALGLMASGTATSAVGQAQAGRAAARMGRFNASIMEQQTRDRIAAMSRQQTRQTATNITRVAKSGVRLSGSPLAAIVSNEYEAARQRDFVRRSGMLSAEISRTEGRNRLAASRMGVASSVLSGAGQLGGLAVKHYA